MDFKIGLRAKLLFCAFLISALPLLLLLTFLNFEIRTQTRHQARESIQADLHAAQGQIDQRADELLAFSQMVAEMTVSTGWFEPISATTLTGGGKRLSPSMKPGRYNIFFNKVLNLWRIDFLIITDAQGFVCFRANGLQNPHEDFSDHPLISQGIAGKSSRGLVRETPQRLAQEGLSDRARILQTADRHSMGSDPSALESAGLCIEAAVPILNSNKKPIGSVLAGDLLNNDFTLVDTIGSSIHKNRPGDGTVSIYLDEYAITTTFTDGENRAVGWQASNGHGPRGSENLFGHLFVSANETLKDVTGQPIAKLQVARKESGYLQPENHFRRRVLLATGLFLLFMLAGIAAAVHRFTRPIFSLIGASNQISLGDLDVEVNAKTNDEFEALAESVERMRLSLRAALGRLKKI